MTNTKTITDFRVTWTADHEQYWQGHGIAFTDYTHCATGVGETLREAFEDALDSLFQQTNLEEVTFLEDSKQAEMLAELTAQVKEPEMLDWDISRASSTLGKGLDITSSNAGEWHYYVSIDVKVEE